MRLGSVLALAILLAGGVTAFAEDCCGLRCVSQCFQISYSDSVPETEVVPNADLTLELPGSTASPSSAANWGPFPRLPGLRGVRGLTGVIGNLMQTNPHAGGTWYSTQAVQGQPTTLGMNKEFFQFSAPVWSDGDDTIVVSTHAQVTNISTGAILPTTGNPFPTQLWNIWFGMNYFHVFENGVIGAMLVEGGSASDKTLQGQQARNDSAAGTGLLIIPTEDRDAWILGIQASTNSQVLYNIPIPGAAYLYSPSDAFQAIIGFPYSAINYQVNEAYRLQLLYMFLTTVHARGHLPADTELAIVHGLRLGERELRPRRPPEFGRSTFSITRNGDWSAGNGGGPSIWAVERLPAGYAFDRATSLREQRVLPSR